MVYRRPGKGEIIPLSNNSSNQNCELTEDVDLSYANDDLEDRVAFGQGGRKQIFYGGATVNSEK